MAAEKPLSQLYFATKKLLDEQPHWARIITACIQLSEESPDGAFWSSAVLNRAQQRGHSLAPLRARGILERVDRGARNNHAASYRLPDREGVKQALADVDLDAKLPGDFFDLHNRKKAG
jgi:hypothetical protein